MTKKRVLLLVDGDMVAFSHAAAEEYGKAPEEISFAKIQASMESKMLFLAQRCNATDVICCVSGPDNMRNIVEPSYKANRDGVWRPENLANAKAALITMFNGIWMKGLEADDLVAFLSRWKYDLDMGKRGEIKSMTYQGHRDDYDEVVIASLDKDIPQIANMVGDISARIRHYRWETQHAGEKFVEPTPFGELKCIVKTDSKGRKKKEVKGNGIHFFLHQLLIGDGTDGIMGCGYEVTKIRKSGKDAGKEYQARDGVGQVESYELLKNCTSYAEGLKTVITQYIMRFGDGWEKEFIKTGRLVYMHNRISDGHWVHLWHYKGVDERLNLKTGEIRNFS